MVRKAIAAVLALTSAVCAIGCGTFCNLLPSGRYMHVQWTNTPRQVYGGVQFDLGMGWESIAELLNSSKKANLGDATYIAAIGIYFVAVDLPVCAVMDTLTLYITVPD